MLRNFYRVGQRQIERSSPWGIVIPKNQRDPGATRRMLDTLAFGAVEIGTDADGDFVIPMRQPYSGYAKACWNGNTIRIRRSIPAARRKRPYDVTAHTLPLLFGVEVKFVEQPVAGPIRKADLAAPPVRAIYKAADTDAWKAANEAWAGGRPVWRNEAGDFALTRQGAGWSEVKRPRIGAVQELDGGHRRGLDALASRPVRFCLREPAQCRRAGRESACPVRFDRVRRRDAGCYRVRSRGGYDAAGVHRRSRSEGRGRSAGIHRRRWNADFSQSRRADTRSRASA